jgi:hypothetical protein
MKPSMMRLQHVPYYLYKYFRRSSSNLDCRIVTTSEFFGFTCADTVPWGLAGFGGLLAQARPRLPDAPRHPAASCSRFL